jgi:glycine cleavage system transcriptional repressor
MEKFLAITAIGPDRAGLVRDISEVVTAAGGNIRESRMMTLGSEFAVLMLVAGNWHAIEKIQESLPRLTESSDLTINLRSTTPKNRTAPAAPYNVDAVSLDQEGIVLNLAGFFAGRNLEIAELNTRRYNAPHTGAAMFAVQMTVNIPGDIHLANLRDEFHEFCEERNLDAIIEPAQR